MTRLCNNETRGTIRAVIFLYIYERSFCKKRKKSPIRINALNVENRKGSSDIDFLTNIISRIGEKRAKCEMIARIDGNIATAKEKSDFS